MTMPAAVLSPWAVCSRQYCSCYRPTTLTTWVQDRCASREDRPGFALRACGCFPPKRPLMLVAWKLARRPSGCAGFPRCRAGPPARCGARAPTTFASFSQHQRLPVRSLLPGARHECFQERTAEVRTCSVQPGASAHGLLVSARYSGCLSGPCPPSSHRATRCPRSYVSCYQAAHLQR